MKTSIGALFVVLVLVLYFFSCGRSEPYETSVDEINKPEEIDIDNDENTPPEDVVLDTLGNTANCITNGGKANDTGLKTWCWGDIDIPNNNAISPTFQKGQLTLHTECNPNQVTKVGNLLRFHLNPKTPAPQEWCNNSFNIRAELLTGPWEVNHPKGTEEWFGWSYTFGEDYIIDTTAPWLFYQVHHAVVGDSPHLELLVGTNGLYGGSAGEIIVNNAANSDYLPTGVIPRAGETVDIVVHAIWGDESNGLLQVWMNGNQVYDKQVRTVYSHYEYGGNAKFGIYKWYWGDEAGVQASLQQGITQMTTYMGPLRVITRRPDDPDYGKDSYSEVTPD